MTALLIGYARVSTDAQDLTAPRDWMPALGVAPGRLYVDHGLTGTNRVDLPPHRTAPSAPGQRTYQDVTVEPGLGRAARW